MSWFVDSSVLLLAVGAEDPRRPACQAFLARVGADPSGSLHASVEAVQEFLFHRLRRVGVDRALTDTRRLRAGLRTHDFDEAVLDLSTELVARTSLRGKDAVHAATAMRAGFTEIVSADRDFDGIPGLRRLDPADA